MNPGGADRVSLAGGIALGLLGALLCLDQLELISLGLGLAAAAICAAAGSILVVSGLAPEPDLGQGGDSGEGADG